MTEYKPNFNTKLPWSKVLQFLNELLEHEIDSSSSNGEMEYIIVEINQETKDTLRRLGTDLNTWSDDFCNPDEGWIDITVLVWGGITFHYGHGIWYTGKEFVVQTDRERELLKMARDMYRIIIRNGYNLKIPDDMEITFKEYMEMKKEWGKLLDGLEGDAK